MIATRSKVDSKLKDEMWTQQKRIKPSGMSMQVFAGAFNITLTIAVQAYMFGTLQCISSYAMMTSKMVQVQQNVASVMISFLWQVQNMPCTHIAYEKAQEVAELVVETNKKLNESMSEYNELQELQEKMTDFPINLAKETRKLVRRARLECVSRVSNGISAVTFDHRSKVELILLTDMCIVADFQMVEVQVVDNRNKSLTKTQRKEVLGVKAVLPLEKIKATPIKGSDYEFELYSPQMPQPIILECDSTEHRYEWVRQLALAEQTFVGEKLASVQRIQVPVSNSFISIVFFLYSRVDLFSIAGVISGTDCARPL